MISACNGRDDTPCCAASSLRKVLSVAAGPPCYPDADTLPRRHETQFLKKYDRRVSWILPRSVSERAVRKIVDVPGAWIMMDIHEVIVDSQEFRPFASAQGRRSATVLCHASRKRSLRKPRIFPRSACPCAQEHDKSIRISTGHGGQG